MKDFKIADVFIAKALILEDLEKWFQQDTKINHSSKNIKQNLFLSRPNQQL